MRKLIFLALVLGLVAGWLGGCSEPMIAAFGSNSEVVIVTSPECVAQAGLLKAILEREIVTIQYENAFQVRVAATGQVGPERDRKNIILLDVFTGGGDVAGTIEDLAGAREQAFKRGETHLASVSDRWARGQVVMLIAAPTTDRLGEFLESREDEVFAFVESQVQDRLNHALFYGGEQEALTSRLQDSYGWSIRLPTGYEVDEKYASQRVIKILKDKPARMITIYWEGGEWDDMAARTLERKQMLAWEFWDQDEMVEDNFLVTEGAFKGRPSVVVTGIWENKKYTIGGPFITYGFNCAACGRNYVIDGSVFAPGLEKLPLIREIRAILATFECCAAR
jgi:hypothetical protein